MASRRTAAAQKKLRVLRRTLIVPYVCAALLLLPLALIRKWNSEIIADLTVRSMTFDLTGPPKKPLVDLRAYDHAYVVQSASAEIRDASGTVAIKIGPDGALSMERPTLADLHMKLPAHVTLERNEPGSVSLSISESPVIAALTLPEGTIVECEYCEAGGATHERYQKVIAGKGNMRLASDGAHFQIVLTGSAPAVGSRLHVRNLSFVTGALDEPESSVIGGEGKITLRDVKDFEIELADGDFLAFPLPHSFTITNVKPDSDGEGLRITMAGSVREVRSGRLASVAENRMPTMLQRLHANQALALYFAGVIFVAGTAIHALRELHVIRDQK